MIPGMGRMMIPQTSGIAQTVVFGGTSGNAWTSTDGATLSSAFTLGSGTSISGVAYRGGTWVACNERYIYSSTDGTSWTQRMDYSGGGASAPTVLIWGNNEFICRGTGSGVGVAFVYSADGLSWSTGATPSGINVRGLAWSSDLSLYAAVGLSGGIITGATSTGSWTSRTSGTGNNLFGVAYGNGKFVAVGDSGTIRYSTTGLTWSGATSGTTAALTGVCWTGSYFVACGAGGVLFRSADGVTWSSITSGTSNGLSGIFANGSHVFAVGQNGVSRSTDFGASFSDFSSSVPSLSSSVYPSEGA